MGYTTEFDGYIEIVPPLSKKERDYINKFSGTRRMNCVQGPYYVDRGGDWGQDNGRDVLDYNSPPLGQPGLWCQWVASEDGSRIEWDGGEKFYSADRWMAYIIDHFIRPGAEVMELSLSARASLNIPDFTGHVCSGLIRAQRGDPSDVWILAVQNNLVGVQSGRLTFEPDADIAWRNESWDAGGESAILALGVRIGGPRATVLQYFEDNSERLIQQIGMRATTLLGSALGREAEGIHDPGQAYKFARELVPGIVIKERPDLVPKPGWSAACAMVPGGTDCVKVKGGLALAFILVAINAWERTHTG